jgi:hypothetical protein
MLVELRRYSVLPGQLDRMHSRMRDVLLPLFREHGVPPPFAIWTTDLPDASLMTWMLKWPGLDERNATWAAFRPIWEAAKKARGGDEFVTRTDLTLIDEWPSNPLSFPAGTQACESSWIVQPKIGHGAAFRAANLARQFAAFASLGARNVAACDFMFGPLPQSLIILSWTDPAGRERGVAQIEASLLAGAHGGDEQLIPTLAAPGTWLPLTRAPYLTTWQLRA